MALTLEDEAVQAMRRVLRGYAERHMVKDLDEAGEAVDFALPGAGRLRLVCDPAKRSLTLRGLLPDVPAKSPLAEELAGLMAKFRAVETPEHRRVDPAQASLALRRAGRGLALVLSLREADWEWGVRRMINLAHAVRVMVHAGHPFFAQTHWGASEE